MRRDAGGNAVNTAVGLGLTAGLFVVGWVVLGAMVVLNRVLGGAETPFTDAGGGDSVATGDPRGPAT